MVEYQDFMIMASIWSLLIKIFATITRGEPVFSYMLITDKQNSYIHQFKRVFRFLGYIQSEVDSYLANAEMTLPEDYRITVGDRAEQADASPLEIHFEDSFSNAYGMNALRYLTREYGISDENGNNYFLDYFIRTQTERYAVEENGLNFIIRRLSEKKDTGNS